MADEVAYFCEWLDGETLDRIMVPFTVRRTWYGVDIVVKYWAEPVRMRCYVTGVGVACFWGSHRTTHRGHDWTVGDAMDWLAHRFGYVLIRPEEPSLFESIGGVV